MSAKNRDQKGRWRSITIAFRVSPEENARINEAVKLAGITKQDFITSKLLNRDVIVAKSPRTFKALRDNEDFLGMTLLYYHSTLFLFLPIYHPL